MSREILRLENIEKYYSGNIDKLHIIRNLSLTVEEGEFISILGRSGSGKSTLLNIIGLLDKIDKGKIYIGGQEVEKLSDEKKDILKNGMLGFVFQFHYLLPEFTALENVMLPALVNDFKNRKEVEKRAMEILEAVGLKDRVKHKPSQLSGGEKQRVAIARALINSPKILLADEPTGNLDSVSEREIMEIFTDFNKQGKTIIVVTHEPEVAKYMKRVLLFKDGRIIRDGEPE